MRGKRTFRKVITRMPSGRFAWNVLDSFDNRLDGGLARTRRAAIKLARAAEKSQPIYQEKQMPADAAYQMRNQNRDCCR